MKIQTQPFEDHLYLNIAKTIEGQISKDILRIGDKLPSVRILSKEQGISPSTVLQAYYHLESKGLIESRPKSGYYVIFSQSKFPAVPEKSRPDSTPLFAKMEDIISEVYGNLENKDIINFALNAPGVGMLPIAKLNKSLIEASRTLDAGGTYYENVMGNLKLRRQIARRSILWQGNLKEDEIITTSGCISALAFSLMAVTEKGDTVAVESPVYVGILRLADSLGLRVLELPTDPFTGVDINALKKVVQTKKIKACLFVSNFSNPLGCCIPDESKKEIVELLDRNDIPLIEDDIYGDIYFGKSRPKTCKTFDRNGSVLWCSSVSKTLAPGYRVGWVAPGRYMKKIKNLKIYHSITSTTLMHEAVGNFLENGRYEHHLRKLREVLHGNSLQYIRAVTNYFPAGTKVSRPAGGYALWIELDEKVNTIDVYRKALSEGISIAPGRMFTLHNQYNNCMRLSYALLWNKDIEKALKRVGEIIIGL